VDWQSTIFSVIDMRSFSNLWFWIALAVMWSTTSHWVLGVPFDMVARARRHGGSAEQDLEDMVRINVNRLLQIIDDAGVTVVTVVTFALTSLAILGFVFWMEFAQAVLLLAAPMTVVGMVSIGSARRIRSRGATGAALRGELLRHRRIVQVIGMVSVFVTAMWGMYMNLTVGPFGS
jgi:hypothetical protein